MSNDARWMAAAARLSERARPRSSPNPGVACLIIKDGILLSRGWTQAGGRPHAEAQALAQLSENETQNATVYVTLEPCAHHSDRGPACVDLLVAARPARAVIGIVDPDPRTAGRGIARLEAEGIEVAVLDCEEARRSLAGFLANQTLQRPYVTLKLAMSADGFIARQPGQEQWITGEKARAHVHAQRARHDAILVGRGTWDKDHPRLDVRLPGIENRSPQKYVLTTDATLKGARALPSPAAISGLSGIQYLYVEGGASTAQAFLDAGLVDELHIYTAPIDIGEGLPAPGALQSGHLANNGDWHLVQKCQLGSDTFAAYQRTNAQET